MTYLHKKKRIVLDLSNLNTANLSRATDLLFGEESLERRLEKNKEQEKYIAVYHIKIIFK